jgi:TolA-binding protein
MLSTLTVYAQTAEESYRQTLKDYLEESRTYYKHQKEHQLKRIDDFYNSQLQSAQSEETETNNALELNLIRFVREHPTSNYLPYALYQLGSIYFERGDKDVEAFAAAEKYFNELFTQYPKFLYSEETLYLLAYSRLSQNKEKEAIQSFTTLLKIYPKSRFIDESNLRIGEFYFHKGEYANALTYYQRILLKPEAPFYNKALYKIAWANYLSQKFEIALRNFITILNLGKNNEFYSEAKQYVAFSLYQLKLGEQAVSQLKPVWSDETYQACLQYGDLLMENGQYRSAAALYQALVDYYPSHPDTPKTSYLTAHALHLQGENQRALQIELIHLQKFNAKDDTRKAVLFDIGSYYYQGWT